MALTIDELNIQIEADCTNATTALDVLISKLKTLQSRLNSLGSSGKNAGKGLKETSSGATKVTSALNKYNQSTDKATKTSKGFTDVLAQKISKFHTLYGAFKAAAQTMGDWFNESNDYIETLNLFNVTMGEGADAAYEYAQKVQNLVGIDIGEWMQYQGVFKNLLSTPPDTTSCLWVGTPSASKVRPMEFPSRWGSSVMVTMGAAITSPSLPFRGDMPSITALPENAEENTDISDLICFPEKIRLYLPEGTRPAPIFARALSTASPAISSITASRFASLNALRQ